jgi:hypothetical protein
VVLADHGQIGVDWDQALVVSEWPDLDEKLLLPPAGEARAAFLYPRVGHLAKVEAFLGQEFSERFAVVRSVEALEADLFGPVPWAQETPGRAGDLLLLARGRALVEQNRTLKGAQVIGRHGGLSPSEMLIPFLAARLDAL